MREIDPSHVNEFYLLVGDKLSTKKPLTAQIVRHYASRKGTCGMLTKVCKTRINYSKRSCFLHYLLTV